MHFPLMPGETGPDITRWQEWFQRAYKFYAPPVTGVFDDDSVAATKEMQRRLGLNQTGHFNIQTAKASGYIETPLFFTVEGHMSNMFAGPVADTATQLEAEGLCHHLPTGYNNGAIPFDNQSGVDELARRLGQTVQDNGVRFPAGTPFVLGGFSQGMIVLYDFMEQHFSPGGDLEWRKDDCLGYLFYGNPCRAKNSGPIKDGSHGLDPYKRFGLDGCYPQPDNVYEVWREGDIFAQNTDDLKGQLKASIYEAVARGDFFSNPYGLVSELLSQMGAVVTQNYFELLTFGIGVVQAIVSGVVFLADNPNPHYSPYDIEPGKAWVRNLLS
jgi:hypothetical protein